VLGAQRHTYPSFAVCKGEREKKEEYPRREEEKVIGATIRIVGRFNSLSSYSIVPNALREKRGRKGVPGKRKKKEGIKKFASKKPLRLSY